MMIDPEGPAHTFFFFSDEGELEKTAELLFKLINQEEVADEALSWLREMGYTDENDEWIYIETGEEKNW